ncbi:MAG: 50S ribosomal protein L24 [bacterium]
MKIKKNDNIIVIAGKDKGKTGKVSRVFPAQNKVLVIGINVHRKNQRAKKAGEKGQIIEQAFPINVSNVMLAVDGKRTRVGSKMIGDRKVRIAKKTGKEI